MKNSNYFMTWLHCHLSHHHIVPITEIGNWIREAYAKEEEEKEKEKEEKEKLTFDDCEPIDYSDCSFSPIILSFDREEYYRILSEHLDEEDIKKLEVITNVLEEFYHDKKLNDVLPLLKKILTEYEDKIFFYSDNPITITPDYKILLPDFGNIELKLADLTKAIYLLFCEDKGGGINIKNLELHYSKIWHYYQSISPNADLVAMQKSIEDLTKPGSKAIYSHISRIKKALQLIMDDIHVKSFMITSDSFGDNLKYIPIIKGLNYKSYDNKNTPDDELDDVAF